MGVNYSEKEIAVIIIKSAYAILNAREQELLNAYLNESDANRSRYQELIDAGLLKQKLAHYAARDQNQELNFQKVMQGVQQKAPVYAIHHFKKYGWAAAVLLLLMAGGWFFVNNRKPRKTVAAADAKPKQDVLPGKEGAILTLSNGTQVVLDSLGNGTVVGQQGADIELRNGALAYNKAGIENNELLYNTLTTPKGREFKIVLPDGTQAWLNSYSSIRYPIQFGSKERVVSITGEVYFEVAHLLQKDKKTKTPFIVKIHSPQGEDAGTVEVLGTHFNINAYSSASRTTLLEGKVVVRSEVGSRKSEVGGQKSEGHQVSVMLRPGEQAVHSPRQSGQALTIHDSPFIIDHSPNIDQVMAWRRGFFNFDNAGLQVVMEQLSRWYDVEVEYPHGIPAITFEGELSRTMTLNSVLKALEDSKVHFEIAGKKIIILP